MRVASIKVMPPAFNRQNRARYPGGPSFYQVGCIAHAEERASEEGKDTVQLRGSHHFRREVPR